MCNKEPSKITLLLAALAMAAVLSFVEYGLDTQCPNVAVYQYCSKGAR